MQRLLGAALLPGAARLQQTSRGMDLHKASVSIVFMLCTPGQLSASVHAASMHKRQSGLLLWRALVVVGLVSDVQTCCSASYEAARRCRSNVNSEGRQCFCRTLEDIAAAEKGLAAMREKLSGLAAELQGVLVPASS